MSDAALRLLGAFIMLIIGFAVYVLVDRVAYRPLRQRYERLKAMGRRGLEPNVLMAAMRIGLFIGLPALGFLVGPPLLRLWLA
jgi:hypothetical protein